ncbi:hypothetical protein [Paenibacillus hexagrammi]|uniref:Uncharacterized protein n=1 Tax=Paenibacillus hexagrammi TaxID=2908839 RepID=A0ABY3SUD3_9BACL|nr:hypothetical protein [Paenibacillus sp. YPD9-1]UJF36552.1 hypothetical protein L0M14_30660 [Paenibacillus sp. YPD9-1]
MIRLRREVWENIFRNTAEANEEVEAVWLDPGDSSEGEWCLCCDCELFEDGFQSEKEAMDRLAYLEQAISRNAVRRNCGMAAHDLMRQAIGIYT